MNSSYKEILTTYALDFHASLPEEDGNTVASALGSWLLLSALATGVDFTGKPDRKAKMEQLLCTDISTAEQMLKDITQLEQINYAAHAWSQYSKLSDLPVLNKWWKHNKNIDSTPKLPTQEWLNEWANKNTNGLISQFPMQVNPAVIFLAANIIYSKFSWSSPFIEVENVNFKECWDVPSLLFSKNHTIRFVEQDGKTLVHVPVHSKTKETVHLYMALKEMSDSELMKLALKSSDPWSVKNVPYSEIETVPGVVEFEKVIREYGPEYQITLPAWTANSRIDLTEKNSYGFNYVTALFEEESKIELAAEALQVAVAKFKKEGFEAAAVTAYMMRAASFAVPQPKLQDVVKVHFSRKFAFVCTVKDLPVFAGIIKKADAELD